MNEREPHLQTHTHTYQMKIDLIYSRKKVTESRMKNRNDMYTCLSLKSWCYVVLSTIMFYVCTCLLCLFQFNSTYYYVIYKMPYYSFSLPLFLYYFILNTAHIQTHKIWDDDVWKEFSFLNFVTVAAAVLPLPSK